MSNTAPAQDRRTELPAPGRWTIDATHTTVGFWVRHLGLAKVRGGFGRFDGEVVIASDPARSTLEVAIDTASVDTREQARDEHLRSGDFLDVANHPTMRFVATSVSGSGSRWQVGGDLTIRGITNPVVLDTAFEGVAADPWGNTRAAFHAETEIDREDFGLTFNQVLETGGLVVGKRIHIEIDVELVRAE